ncbi:penicillin acylase family protein [Sandaracinus amylolyticus]|uniref:penicillin acylase family protein n=1 Tax=Sandaracinus amylolyticus TaxID=927083 RepID=UPI001F2E6ECD|nr:penicillin acylase family protein [Sandaracinus amylolyticus]
MRRVAVCVSLFASFVMGCSCEDDPAPVDAGSDAGPQTILHSVPETERFTIPCLSEEAQIVRTEMNVPHIYAASREDAFCALGFVMARDRFFQMDLTRRLSQGRLSELLGDAALATDIEERMKGGAFVTDLQTNALTDDEAREVDAFAAGINAYVAAASNGDVPLPSEVRLGAALLGAGTRPWSLLHEWDRRDVIACGVTVLYSTSFETGDVGRDRDHARVDTLFEGMPDRALRLAGVRQDVMERYAPPRDTSSASGWGLETASKSARVTRRRGRARHHASVETAVMDRLTEHLERIVARMPRTPGEGYGSNVWAVAGSSTPDGRSLLSGDGHLQLSVPALFWQVGIDTAFLSEGADDTRLLGATIPGLPTIGVGTNGHVAWSQTAYFADVTDWYREEIVLGEDGLPRGARFQGEERALARVDEEYEIADVPALDSVGRTETIARFTTFDGRWITSIEGETVEDGAERPASAVNMMGEWIVPGDVDGDGVVSAVSFDYGPFDGGVLLRAFRLFGLAENVEDYRQAMRHFIGYGGSMMASDTAGDVLYSAYHAVPCRSYLPRDGTTNRWIEGADPRRLIDGTQYGGWSIPLTAEGRVDEAAAATDPDGCAVPFDEWPQALSPARGYVQHANNDPGAIATDGDLFDDPHYIGGPWIEGYRASRIAQRLEQAIAAERATIAEMQDIQGDHRSNLGEEWVPLFLEELERARTTAAGTPAEGTSDARVAAMWRAEQAAFEDVEGRLRAWRDADYPTPSGVETFYSTPAAEDRAHAIATTIFGTWFPRFVRGTLDDEGIPGGLSPAVTGDTYRMQTMLLLVRGRGPGNPESLGSYEPTREESVFFDDVATTETETSHEIVVRALRDALVFLRSEPSAPGEGGFGSDDPDDWIWGLRHGVRFESLLADFLGDDPMFSVFVDNFSITPERIDLADGIGEGDPRAGLTFFPRPGDQFDVDAANPGLSGERFTHGSGPVFRMVIALGGEQGVEGWNVIPGGQSGITQSEHFDDQVRLWLGNETIPMRWHVEDVVEGGVGREVLVPMQ